MSNIAVKFENVSKFYKLYNSPKDRLKEALHPLGKKRHREFYALKNINLEVKKGEILGIVGRNGSGKSTLLKIISGVIQPNSGKAIVNGEVSALLELGSGLNPDYDGIQNIYFGGIMMGFSRAEMKRRIYDIIAFAEIGEFIHQPLKTYSSGMKARLGFALAVNISPEILVVDEVLSVGDDLFKRKCYAKMEELFKANCTVFFVSHSQSNINEICTRAILIDRGELILEGSPKLVTTHYQKYLFVKPEEAEKTRTEIIQLNKDANKKMSFSTNLEEKKGWSFEENDLQDEQQEKPEAYFIPNFIPKSTVVTKNYDVDIYDIHIRTKKGKKVNVLMMNEEYIYSYKVKFNIDAVDVGVGVPFKTERGLLITNYTLYGHFIKEVKIGAILSVDCHFKCIFLPGVYYATAEVGAVIDGERMVLNRIVDALAFKVEAEDPGLKWGGIIYCGQYFNLKIE
ncbi:MAG: ABC transporter ATP-binding protein [Candidatus Aminicenantes bacterium]|nr:ABC transporter ATP-binding protein [Candidatus Aminicenantes bacterium]